MERFNCHGRLNVALHNGVADVEISHRQSHKSYVGLVSGTHGPYLKTELLSGLLLSRGS